MISHLHGGSVGHRTIAPAACSGRWPRRTTYGDAMTLNGLLNDWALFVRQVETGYTDNSYEYFNDLSCRGQLATAWPLLTDEVRSERQAELDAADARFLAATVPGPDSSGTVGTDDAWWEDRRPVLLVGELAEDFG